MPDASDAIAELRFRHPWRPYQARVLAAIDAHLKDDRLHIVAAPGSGKTILGLEIFRRLGHAAVVFAPTITIRDQWLARLSLFLPEGKSPPDWASNSLEAPGALTCVTYQSLHARVRQASVDASEEEPGADEASDDAPQLDQIQRLVRTLREGDVRTLILDEAHHLRRDWWRALDRIAHALEDVTLVSLTATPPYDVVGLEWSRYESLCGPIDEEISVPELVKSGVLAPHDDFVRAVAPDEQTRLLTRQYDDAVARVLGDFERDKQLIDAVANHAWMTAPSDATRDILETPDVAVAMIAFLNHVGRPAPRDAAMLLAPGDGKPVEMSRRWWQALIKSYLSDAHWPTDHEMRAHRDAMAKTLRAAGLLYRRELRIEASRPVADEIAMTAAKSHECLDIHRMEREARGAALRQVILTDYIRDGAPRANGVQLGAWPIFHELANAVAAEHRSRLTLLTGRLTLIHKETAEAFLQALGENAASVTLAPSNLPDGFLRATTSRNDLLVPAITELFAQGRVDTIVGTRALLGEGWDAPCVNSLILVSYVGAYMTTNQMRGRAIRRDPDRPDKAASIWHVVAVDHETEAGLQDAWTLDRRFDAFVGLDAWAPVIESGIARIKLPEPWSERFIERVNADMCERLRRIGDLHQRWREAIDIGAEGRVIPTLRSNSRLAPRKLLVRNTVARLLAMAAAAAIGPIQFLVSAAVRSGGDGRSLAGALAIAGTLALIGMAPGLHRAIRTMLRFYPVDGSLRQISLALRDALVETGRITSSADQLDLIVETQTNGVVSVALRGATFYESSLFADCLREILAPIDNPRYLIVRRGSRWIGQSIDYHAVPTILGERKEQASVFHRAWTRQVGGSSLIYTRTPEGWSALLRARVMAFSSTDREAAQRLDQWR
ncbi:MAG TPA: DEAD/DEAH box helicase family protein [Phycisphaerae bacterium]|nr:DEAD/DEAH box helicase family protein [Phycisphaerae bacterium]HRW52870.1 DEAD/DEAH box helicase family protein [Phycisphaerae bacterium]